MKFSKTFETPFFGLKRCLAVSMTFLHSDNTIFREKVCLSCFFNNIANLTTSLTSLTLNVRSKQIRRCLKRQVAIILTFSLFSALDFAF